MSHYILFIDYENKKSKEFHFSLGLSTTISYFTYCMYFLMYNLCVQFSKLACFTLKASIATTIYYLSGLNNMRGEMAFAQPVI